MPTPARTSGETGRLSLRSSCPPEDERSSWSDAEMEARNQASVPREVLQQATPPAEAQNASATEAYIAETHAAQRIDIEETAIPDMLSPLSAAGEKQEASELSALSNSDLSSTSMGYDFSNIRLIPSSPSSFLRAGSRFRGSQQSERSTYEVQVEIKHVDMRESFLCGYLRIQGLTEDHPTLTTYFEGEIIGSKYTFMTQHSDWGSTDTVDINHWVKFSSFRPYLKQAKRKNCTIPHLAQRENIFMRWKEQFLVPDHRVRTITGASFEGFYYICFNQLQGTVSGIYFHAKSEKFQQLELKHVEDHGCFPAMEFR